MPSIYSIYIQSILFQICSEVRRIVERITGRRGVKPLQVKVTHSHVVAHQVRFVPRVILSWNFINSSILKSLWKYMCLFAYLFVHICVCLHICLFTYLFVCIRVCLHTCLFAYVFGCNRVCLHTCLFTYLIC